MTTAGWVTAGTALLIIVGVVAAWGAVIRRYPLDDAVGPWRLPDPTPRHVRSRWARHEVLENRIATLRSTFDSTAWRDEVDRVHLLSDEAASRPPRDTASADRMAPGRFSYPWLDGALGEIEQSLQLEPVPADPAASFFVRWRARRHKKNQHRKNQTGSTTSSE